MKQRSPEAVSSSSSAPVQSSSSSITTTSANHNHHLSNKTQIQKNPTNPPRHHHILTHNHHWPQNSAKSTATKPKSFNKTQIQKTCSKPTTPSEPTTTPTANQTQPTDPLLETTTTNQNHKPPQTHALWRPSPTIANHRLQERRYGVRLGGEWCGGPNLAEQIWKICERTADKRGEVEREKERNRGMRGRKNAKLNETIQLICNYQFFIQVMPNSLMQNGVLT